MDTMIKRIINGCRPNGEEILSCLKKTFPLICKLYSTPQDKEWHGEGNVGLHTQMVIEELYKIIDSEGSHLSHLQKATLIIAAALYDIGKPLVTREKEINGQTKIVAPGHEIQGCSYLAFRILDLDTPYEMAHSVLNLVAYHHKPKLLVIKELPKRDYFQLARFTDLELVYFLAKADILGRKCPNQNEQVDLIDLFKLYSEEYDLWRNPDPYKQWKDHIATEVVTENQNSVYGPAILDYESGKIQSPYEAPPRYYRFTTRHSKLVCLCGLSGSGKSEWSKHHLKGYHTISLDNLREKIGKGIHDQSKNKEVYLQAVKELKTLLGQKKNIVWDATNLRKDFRRILFTLGNQYNAYITLIVFHEKLSISKKGNNERLTPVLPSVLETQLERFQWVEPYEAHSLSFVHDRSTVKTYGNIHS